MQATPDLFGDLGLWRGHPLADGVGKKRPAHDHLGVRESGVAPLRNLVHLQIGDGLQFRLRMPAQLVLLGTVEPQSASRDADHREHEHQPDPA